MIFDCAADHRRGVRRVVSPPRNPSRPVAPPRPHARSPHCRRGTATPGIRQRRPPPPRPAARRRCSPPSRRRGATAADRPRRPRRLALAMGVRWLLRSGLLQILLTTHPAFHQHRWGSAGGCQHLLPSVVSWVTRIADVVPDAVRSDHLTAGRAVDRRGAGWPWCRSVRTRVGLLSTALNRALARRAQRIAGRRRRSRRRRQLVRGQRIDPVVDRRRRNDATPGVDTLVASRPGRGAGQNLVRIAVPGVGAQRHVRLVAAAFRRRRRPLTRDVNAWIVARAANHVALVVLWNLAVGARRQRRSCSYRRAIATPRPAGIRSDTAAAG